MVVNKKIIRDFFKLIFSLIFCWLYFPHLILLTNKKVKDNTLADVENLKKKISIKLKFFPAFIYLLHTNRYYRNLFYYRIGPVMGALIGWWRPGDKYFIISPLCEIGPGVIFSHPYSTVINAKKIGKNFSFIQLTTIGMNGNDKAEIGDNVILGANVNIIGGVKIGNNVIIGAGSVVVKDLPDNCVAAGNPAKIIRYIEPKI